MSLLAREIRARQLYYSSRRDILCNRVSSAIYALNESVSKLESYSRINARFFSIPLECAKTMRKLCLEIQEGLRDETPSFELLRRKSNVVRIVQVTRFNRMAHIADRQLHPAGFTVVNVFDVYRKWSLLDGYQAEDVFVHCEHDRRYVHLIFMEVFDVPGINIFGPISSFEEHGVPAIVINNEPNEDEMEEDDLNEVENSRVITGDSRSSSPVLTDPEDESDDDKEEDVVYMSPEHGEFELFELYMEIAQTLNNND